MSAPEAVEALAKDIARLEAIGESYYAGTRRDITYEDVVVLKRAIDALSGNALRDAKLAYFEAERAWSISVSKECPVADRRILQKAAADALATLRALQAGEVCAHVLKDGSVCGMHPESAIHGPTDQGPTLKHEFVPGTVVP